MVQMAQVFLLMKKLSRIDKAVVDPDNNPRSSENNVNAEEVQDEGDDEAAKDTKTEEVQAEKDGLAGAVLV